MTGLQANIRGLATERLQKTADDLEQRLRVTTDEALFEAFHNLCIVIRAEIHRRLSET